ncbi:hypothetical protein ACFV7R_32760 [Streptomyces sp. NPDC059866]|uniref:hypothetical protein n=1 Tax=Streptomyces sp. NPDC059866 TaxID=3346978 RepID=UPI0036527815
MHAQPLDLTSVWGEGWALTLAPRSPSFCLTAMGVTDAAPLPEGLAAFAQRSPFAGPPVLLAAAALDDEWSIVVESEAQTGWVGTHPDVLEALATPLAPACTITSDPNKVQVLFREHGRRVGGMEALTNRRWGHFGEETRRALRGAGFPDGYATPENPVPAAPSEGALGLLAAQAITGAELRSEHLRGPWLGGLTGKPYPSAS